MHVYIVHIHATFLWYGLFFRAKLFMFYFWVRTLGSASQMVKKCKEPPRNFYEHLKVARTKISERQQEQCILYQYISAQKQDWRVFNLFVLGVQELVTENPFFWPDGTGLYTNPWLTQWISCNCPMCDRGSQWWSWYTTLECLRVPIELYAHVLWPRKLSGRRMNNLICQNTKRHSQILTGVFCCHL